MDTRELLIEKLISLGFCFYKEYEQNGKIYISKHPVFDNPTLLEETACDSFDEALKVAGDFLNSSIKLTWSAIMRFNRGLGIEYKNLPDVEATNYEEAINLAKLQAEKSKSDPKIIISEIKVRLKN